jgi:hypothetical protein
VRILYAGLSSGNKSTAGRCTVANTARNLAGFVLLALALTRYLRTKLYSTVVDLQFDAMTIVRLGL